ncbi:Sir2 family NAD-dependent protein deacetylase [Chitinophaga sp. sic0106]|uniref:SIR2 family NAD-dependent protein deacylase n=1 Tax=Chitinophaga sp. sic0106 TaxID=2854785 RepID=UPI001C45246B|nr:Sir2 family NAD-dependent protein deacetylase [Chitinophaga sp. sic0106]MBV7529976.1 NAD-dependent deacylase [Chitinophaga sp. sic0106]
MKKRLVVLTGAGISAESGLKTFRDSDGLWEGYDVYAVASPDGWRKDPALVLDFYNVRRKDVGSAQPNAAHIGLAKLEEHFEVRIITQNIDDLHERAGSTNVMHLHGEIFKMRSVHDEDEQNIMDIKGDISIGDVGPDGGQLRPHIVWFGEEVSMIAPAQREVRMADIFVVVGTSLNVYPAAGLLNYAPVHAHKFIIDKKIPPVDGYYNNLHQIESPATTGVEELTRVLLEKYLAD